MVIINPTISTQPAALTRPAGPAPVLPADRVLNAVVLGERAQHLYELASGSLRMMAESQTPLREGEQLQLRVLGRDSQQRPQLEILQRGNGDIAPQLRNRLPEQLSLNQLSASLDQIRQGDNPTLRQLIAPLLSKLPRRQQLSDADGLQKALHNSGQSLEARLAHGQAPKTDIKAALLKLLANLEAYSPPPPRAGLARSYGPAHAQAQPVPQRAATDPAATTTPAAYRAATPPPGLPGELQAQGRLPPEQTADEAAQLRHLTQAVKGALARQDANQLLGLHNREHSGSYMVELPVRDRDGIDVWQLQFQPPRPEREAEERTDRQQGTGGQSGWAISLSFDLPGLGAMTARVSQQNQQLGIRLEAERATTLQLLEQHSPELGQRLSAQGVEIGAIDCRRSKPQPADSSPTLASLLRDEA